MHYVGVPEEGVQPLATTAPGATPTTSNVVRCGLKFLRISVWGLCAAAAGYGIKQITTSEPDANSSKIYLGLAVANATISTIYATATILKTRAQKLILPIAGLAGVAGAIGLIGGINTSNFDNENATENITALALTAASTVANTMTSTIEYYFS